MNCFVCHSLQGVALRLQATFVLPQLLVQIPGENQLIIEQILLRQCNVIKIIMIKHNALIFCSAPVIINLFLLL